MGRFFLNGKALNINGKPVEYNNGTLSFTVSGDTFPKSYYVSGTGAYLNTRFSILSSEANTAIIDFGDGNVKNYIFKSNNLEFKPSIPLGDTMRQESHTYSDGNSGDRVIRISFGKIDKITDIISEYSTLKGGFPNEIGNVVNLNTVQISLATLTNFPPSFSNLKKIKNISLINIGTAISQRIPDEFNSLNIETLSVSSSINLGDVNTSNLKGFLSNTVARSHLSSLYIDGCKLTELPSEIENCTNLYQLYIGGQNEFETVPSQINLIPSLEILGVAEYYSNNPIVKYWTSLSNLVKLRILDCTRGYNMETNLPADLQNCVKLKTLGFTGVYKTTARVDAFITNLYNFINTYASKTGSNTLPFRGVNTNCTFITPSGTFQQPIGYVAGVSNGTPASPKEMLWVLINQYGHTITYTQ